MKSYRSLFFIVTLFIMLLAGCAPSEPDCSQPQVFCAGLVTDTAGRDDLAFNQSAWEGMQQAYASGTVDWIAVIESVDLRDYERNLQVFTDAGYDVIVSVGSEMKTATDDMAADHAEVFFIGIEQPQECKFACKTNLAGVVFSEDQLGFAAGALAAMLTDSGKVGAVLASEAIVQMQQYGAGFNNGAAYVDGDVEVTVVHHPGSSPPESLADPEWGLASAAVLVSSGVDFIFAAGGETAASALAAASLQGAGCIGAQVDQARILAAAPGIHSSIIKLVAPAVAELIARGRQAQEGRVSFPTGNFQGLIGLSPPNPVSPPIPAEIGEQMTMILNALQQGTLQTGWLPVHP
jgi:basic membrane protein A